MYVRDTSVMGNHGDIAGNALVTLIQQLYRAAVLKSFEPSVLQALGEIADYDARRCGELSRASQP